MNDTPRTDAVYPPDIIDREFAAQGRTFGWGTLNDMRNVSRQLERENNALRAAILDLSVLWADQAKKYAVEGDRNCGTGSDVPYALADVFVEHAEELEKLL